VVGKLSRCMGQLERQLRTRELAEFVNEQADLPVEMQAELTAASAAVDAACTTAPLLSTPRTCTCTCTCTWHMDVHVHVHVPCACCMCMCMCVLGYTAMRVRLHLVPYRPWHVLDV
jgi:hypothetical protein